MSEIRKDQIAEKNVLENLIPTKKQLDMVNALDSALKELAKTAKTGLAADSSTVSGIKAQTDAQEKLKLITAEKVKLDKEKIKLSERLKLADSAQAKENAKLREELNRKNKVVRDGIKADLDQGNAYKKLVRETRDYKNESKRLGAELLALGQKTKTNATQWDDLSNKYRKATNAAKVGDAQLKKLDKTVGDNFRNVGNYRSALGGLSSALGTLGIAVGVGATVRNISGIIADFDQAQTDLASISGKTADELAPLTAQAKELGATTQFSATQITGLQIELAKLGFTSQEITDSTGGIANFAAATGVEIPRAAALAGSALRAFNLDATEIDRVVSTLGVATTKTALDFSQLETGLSTIAPVAASFGFSIEDTTALLGQLSNAGFDASSSATATRNILLNLADANGSLAQELGRPIKSADDLAAGLQELQAKGIDLASALELTDKRSVAAFSTFLNNSGTLVELRDSITDVNGELTDMAEKRLDSVNGQLALLSSAWEGFILDTNEASGAATLFKNAIGFLANNLTTILGLLARAVVYYGTYRATLAVVNSAQNGFLKSLGQSIKNFPKFVRGLKTASFSVKGFSTALKGVPLVAIIAGLTELVMWLFNTEDATNQLTDAEQALNDELERGNELRAERTKSQRDINEQFEIRDKLTQAQIKNLIQEIELEIALSESKEAKIKTAKNEIGTFKEATFNQKELARVTAEMVKLEKDIASASGSRQRQLQNQVPLLQSQIDLFNANVLAEQRNLELRKEGSDLSDDEISNLKLRREQLAALLPLIKDETKSRGKSSKTTKEKTEDIKDLTESLIEQRDYLKESIDYWEEYRRQTDLLNIDEDAIFQADLDRGAPILETDVVEENANNIYDIANELQQRITEALEREIDKRLALNQKEQDAAKSQQDYFKELAAQGNIEAQQSLAKQVEIEREAIREQQRLEKQKQNIQVIGAGLQSFSSALNAGKTPGQAFAETILTTQALVQFLSNLSFFAKGTDNAPAGMAVVDEQGAEIITDRLGNIKQIGSDSGARLTKLAAGDKVKTAEETANIMAQLGAMSNFTSIAPKDKAGTSYDLMTLGKLEAIERAIKNQPHSTTDWNRIGNGMGEIVERKVKGKDIFINRHRIK